MPSSKPTDDLDTLRSTCQNTSRLLQHFTSLLTTPAAAASSGPDISSPPNPLHVLRDACTLLRAHTTKLSLLLLNAPFTPSAVTAVLRSCERECVPAMMAAWEILVSRSGRLWSRCVVAEVRGGLRSTVERFGELVARIGGEEGRERMGGGMERDGEKEKERVCEITGLVWRSCDDVCSFAVKGVPGIMVARVEMWREQIKDAITELKEWGEENDDEDGAGDDDDVFGSDVERLEVFGAENKLPKGRRDVEIRLDEALRRGRLVATLYQALVKRRIKSIPVVQETAVEEQKERVLKMDRLMERLEKIPDGIDELASAFYDLDTIEIDQSMEEITSEALAAVKEVKNDWNGKEDEFTAWARKWEGAINPPETVNNPD